MRVILPALVLGACVFVSGCASIVSDSDYLTTFNSAPAGAEVTITDENGTDVYRGTTPFSTTLSASDGYFDAMDYTARFELACYEPTTVPLKTSLDAWYFGNILFGGLIGMLIVDPATGAMYEIDSRYSATLAPASGQECQNRQVAVVPYRTQVS